MVKKLTSWAVLAILIMGVVFMFNLLKGVTFFNVAGEQTNCVTLGAGGVCQQPKDSVNPVAVGGINPNVTIEQHGSMEKTDPLASLGTLAICVPVGIVFIIGAVFVAKRGKKSGVSPFST